MKLGLVLLYCGVLIEGRLTKVWSETGADSASVVNTSDSIVNLYTYARRSRDLNPSQYFRPRATPIQKPQVYYTQDNYKSEILFPGNFTIATEKSDGRNPADYPLNAETFRPRAIPLMRGQEFQTRSLDEESEEEPEDSQATASRRSLSYVLGVDEDEENEDEEGDEDIEEEGEEITNSKSKIKHKLKKAKKYSKYMMPLLLAYKLKYFALVPVLISGLILLIGATGMAGFFFALFAAVMGLQKGSY